MNGRLSTGNALFPTPGDEVHDGEKQEGLVRRATVCAPNVEFLEISLSRFLISLLNFLRPFEVW